MRNDASRSEGAPPLSTSRRGLLKGLVGLPALAGVLGERGAERAAASLRSVTAAVEDSPSEQAFWEKIRAEFMITDELAYMNNGTLGPTPKPVFYTLVENYRALATHTGPVNAAIDDRAEDVRKKAADFVGAGVDEIAMVRNTTEGMNFIVNGLDLKEGDEILLTFHEHPGGLQPWKLKAKRYGVVLKELPFPIPTPDPSAIVDPFEQAITPRTRVISVSHMTYPTGCMTPVKELAALARSRGILTLVDGAHPLGMMKLDLHDLGIDFYAASPHKWLDAPTGTGLLYMRRDSQDRVWPTVVSTGWDDERRGARRFDRLSQRAWPLVLATGAAMDFQTTIGRERIEARIRGLTGLLRRKLEEIEGIRILTSAHPALHCGLTGFAYEGYRNRDVVETLWRRNHVWVRHTDFDLNTVRVSTHYYNTEEQIERLIEGLKDIKTRGVIPAPEETADD